MHIDLLQGTLDMLILKALTAGPMHGYGVARWLERATDDALRVEEGSLYPALHRLAERGWVRAEWGISENNRRAKYYTLTARGRRQLERELSAWADFTDVVSRVLHA
jgi:transcriptional regulator